MVDIALAPPPPRLNTITTTRELAALMGVNYASELSYILYRFPPSGRYRSFEIEKKNGGQRQIDVPIRLLKKIQRRLLILLEEIYDAPPSVRGFELGESIITNSQSHVGQRFILNVDIQDFFPSIHFSRISGILQSSRYRIHRSVAVAIAQICCKDGVVPIGAPTSGIISNIVCGPLDSSLLRLAKEHRITYTRYADDITFSTSNSRHFESATGVHLGENFVSRGSDMLSDSFKALFHQNGFALNAQKCVAMSRHVRQRVTGLTVNKKVNVSTTFYRNLRATIRAIEHHGYDSANDEYLSRFRTAFQANSLRENVLGRLSFLGNVLNYSERYNKLARRAQAAFPDSSIKRPRDQRERSIYVLNVLPNGYWGSAFYVGNGNFLTAAHLFDRADEMKVCRLRCPTHYPGEISAVVADIDYELDIALVRPTGSFDIARPSIPLDAKDVRIGDDVLACGFPQYNDGNTISTISTRITAHRNLAHAMRMEVDRPLSHGSSGGPVFSIDGFFVGVILSGPELGNDFSPMSYSFTAFNVLRAKIDQWLT